MRVRAHTHSRAHRRSGRIWQRWRLVSGFECLYSILERWPSPKGRAFLGQELSEEKGLVWEGSVSLCVLWTHSQALKCCHPILVPGLHRQPFDPSLKRGWRVDLRDCSDLSFCFCFSRPSAYSYPHLDSLPHPNPNLALEGFCRDLRRYLWASSKLWTYWSQGWIQPDGRLPHLHCA